MENRCICCGEIIPEGRQVCPGCELEPTIKKLKEEYERAKGLAFVKKPLAYALYHTWKAADMGRLKLGCRRRSDT